MEKTVFNLNSRVSIIILSAISVLFSFISNYAQINSIISFLFIAVKASIFVVIPLIVYILEKQSLKFKKIAGIYTSYFVINFVITIIASVSIVNGIVPKIWAFLFNLTNLVILLSSVFILIEQVLNYREVKSKVYENTIMKVVYAVGNFISYPFIAFINKKRGE